MTAPGGAVSDARLVVDLHMYLSLLRVETSGAEKVGPSSTKVVPVDAAGMTLKEKKESRVGVGLRCTVTSPICTHRVASLAEPLAVLLRFTDAKTMHVMSRLCAK